jgi:multidrug efflux system outer membrane protein
MNPQFFSMRSAILSSWRLQRQSSWPRWATRLRWFWSGCKLESNCALPAHAVPSVPITNALGLVVLLACIFQGCATAGADHQQRTSLTPAAFTEQTVWREAAPEDLGARGSWWEIFNDPILTWLETQAKTPDLRLEAAAARVDQARAIAGFTGVDQYPEADLIDALVATDVFQTRVDQPESLPRSAAYDINELLVPLYASYELDTWGRVRRLVGVTTPSDENRATRDTVLFTLEGEIAQTYFLIRYSDEELRILGESIELHKQARSLAAVRRTIGPVGALDLARAEKQMAFTTGEAQRVSERRADLERSLAVLVGVPSEQFSIASLPFDLKPPAIPAGVRSHLLERRPDIADAERMLVERNARLGIGRAAYFPSIPLTGEPGFESIEAKDLLDQTGYTRPVGVSLSQPVSSPVGMGFDADRVNPAYDASLADYQSRILRAFQEVEAALARLRALDEQARYEAAVLTTAQKATRLAKVGYKDGSVSLAEVSDAQRTLLQAQRQVLRVASDQILTTIALIKALGGGWDGRAIPRMKTAVPSHRSTDPRTPGDWAT